MSKESKITISASLMALMISIITVYLQFFFHKQSLYISLVDFTLDKNKFHAEFVVSNLGNQDEVIHKAYLGFEKERGVIYTPNTEKIMIIKDGESSIVNLISSDADFSTAKRVNLYIKLLNSDKVHRLRVAKVDESLERVKYRMPHLDLYSFRSNMCGECGGLTYPNIINIGEGKL
ncbi:hypothetical protein K6U55_09180 [Vibrio diabolicus]|uniref:hypothetical protein n=1 Tax=Vibrio diabolicus TaxID=50719 RepID=UPI00211AB9E4|nr:hypothetical protein [Vibrio diabolicus]MCG6242200.1 hypothetical protein [Vibrio diabolicus]